MGAATGTYFATSVEEMRLTIYPVGKNFFKNPGEFTALNESIYGTSLTNIDMIGSATSIPESSQLTMVSALMVAGMVLCRRRRYIRR